MLVCALWSDQIVSVRDPETGQARRFVRLGGKLRRWKGVAQKHGEEARENLDRAVEQRIPVLGYEVEPHPGLLETGQRKVKHFYLNRVTQLRGWVGLRLDDLKERLDIDGEFDRRGIERDDYPTIAPTLFELVETTAEIPVYRRRPDSVAATANADEEEHAREQGDELENSVQDDNDGEVGNRNEASSPADSRKVFESEEDLVNQPADGDLSNDEYARLALPLLVHHVLRQTDNVMKTITYSDLAEELGRRNKHGEPWPRGLGQVLGRVSAIIERAGLDYRDPPPLLTSVVVLSSGQNAGLPGSGLKNEWRGYESLPYKDRKARVMLEYSRVLSYGSRWNDILRIASLPEASVPPDQVRRNGGWGGGESQAHKALKRFVLNNPALFDAPVDCWLQETEHALHSGDGLDVMFKSETMWLGVEVKSRVSDGNLDDYRRGLFQVVKYRAVLEAQARVDHPAGPPQVRVILVLESCLPSELRQVAEMLDVPFIEQIVPES
ncbi:hypothetical protein BCY88_12995 [Paraburkholderia fungorum]|uniref:Uncharacterized protein n=1 Tax=Paraburkholderia fungorum TaxID=134537 RepID=A0A420FC73_9BURK|nr:hypothetical protein BCY88_12995 [Paraburkholderia fungorum]